MKTPKKVFKPFKAGGRVFLEPNCLETDSYINWRVEVGSGEKEYYDNGEVKLADCNRVISYYFSIDELGLDKANALILQMNNFYASFLQAIEMKKLRPKTKKNKK